MSLDVRPFPLEAVRKWQKKSGSILTIPPLLFVKKNSAVPCSELLVNLVLGASADFELHFD